MYEVTVNFNSADYVHRISSHRASSGNIFYLTSDKTFRTYRFTFCSSKQIYFSDSKFFGGFNPSAAILTPNLLTRDC